MMRSFFTAAFLVSLASAFAVAADESESPPTKFRLGGLFSPEREKDFLAVAAEIPGLNVKHVDYATAEITLEYDTAKLFPENKPEEKHKPAKIFERLDHVVRNASQSTFRIFPPSTTPKDQLTVVQFAVGVLDCKGCCLAVYEMVARIDGVERAVVEAKTGQVSATVHSAKTNQAAIEAELKKHNLTILSVAPPEPK